LYRRKEERPAGARDSRSNALLHAKGGARPTLAAGKPERDTARATSEKTSSCNTEGPGRSTRRDLDAFLALCAPKSSSARASWR
jgi:hypothetical protein